MSDAYKCGHPRTTENSVRVWHTTACRQCRAALIKQANDERRERNAEIVRMVREENAPTAVIASRFSISTNSVRRILSDEGVTFDNPFVRDPLFPARAIKVAACEMDIAPQDITSALREPNVVRARWAVSIAMKERGASFPQIGRRLKRDHSTIIYGIRSGLRLADRDPEFADTLNAVRAA